MAVRDEGQHEAVDEPFLPHNHLAHFVLDLLHQLALRGDAVCRVLQIHVVHSPFEILVELYAETVRHALDATRIALMPTTEHTETAYGRHGTHRCPIHIILCFQCAAKGGVCVFSGQGPVLKESIRIGQGWG